MVEFSEDPWRLAGLHRAPARAAAADRRVVGAPAAGAGGPFLDHFRTILRERRAFQFDEAVPGLDRLSQAAAFLALLEMVKRGEVMSEQQEVFAPIRVVAGAAAAERAIA